VALCTYAPGQPLSQQLTPPNAGVFGHMLVLQITNAMPPLEQCMFGAATSHEVAVDFGLRRTTILCQS
jgi:hypothetical protein